MHGHTSAIHAMTIELLESVSQSLMTFRNSVCNAQTSGLVSNFKFPVHDPLFG